jgi:hypothetical protein
MTNAIASTIAEQMGGLRLLSVMVGAKNFVALEKGLKFSIGKGAKEKINAVKVTLNDMDTYDLEFGRFWGTKYKTIKKVEGVYNDMLMDIFEDATGFFLTFSSRK